jgi:hypothetical protein
MAAQSVASQIQRPRRQKLPDERHVKHGVLRASRLRNTSVKLISGKLRNEGPDAERRKGLVRSWNGRPGKRKSGSGSSDVRTKREPAGPHARNGVLERRRPRLKPWLERRPKQRNDASAAGLVMRKCRRCFDDRS